MTAVANSRGKRRSRPLLHAAKIGERQFRDVLRHFAGDDTAVQTARRIGLSVNAVNALFVKLRRFFVEVGLFTDFYAGGVADSADSDDMQYEYRLLGFHFERMKAKRWVARGQSADDHFAESHWRFHYAILLEDRGGDSVATMMERHLLEAIRRCGPVGRPPVNRRAGLRLALAQMDERVLWALRNSPRFRTPEARAGLSEVLSL